MSKSRGAVLDAASGLMALIFNQLVVYNEIFLALRF